jgi:iron-sulfur cluster assembly accessory protein
MVKGVTTKAVKKNVITRQTTVGDVFEMFPDKAMKLGEKMLSYGLHCVGCHVNTMETIEMGARGHGFDEETIDNLIKELNEVANAKAEKVKDFAITPGAVAKIKDLAAKEKKEGQGLRIKVVPGGCAGFTYDFQFANKKEEGDFVVKAEDLEIYIDQESRIHLKGATMDYIDSLMGSGFTIENPNAKKACGCGSSFG